MNCSEIKSPNLNLTMANLSIIITYVLVFIIALIGNAIMFLILLRNHIIQKRRVHSLLLNMTIAHLIVTLLYMPKEIIHNITVAWWGGDMLCRLCKFFDVFGVALGANMLICISLDRFYSILFPLYIMKAKKRVRRFQIIAYIISFVISLPQLYIFRVAHHPCFAWYTQCISSDLIGIISPRVTFWFSVINLMQVYMLPLTFTILCYGSIVFTISIKTKGRQIIETDQHHVRKASVMVLRRNNGQDNLQRAKSRTLKMTIIVVAAFMFCWTPYTIAMFVHFLMASAAYRPIPILLSRFLYAFAVFNSAISPYLYGYFSFDIKKELNFLFSRTTTTTYIDESFAASGTTTMSRTRRRAVRVSITNENNADSLQHLLERERQKQLNRLTILRKTTLRRGFSTTCEQSVSFRGSTHLIPKVSSDYYSEYL